MSSKIKDVVDAELEEMIPDAKRVTDLKELDLPGYAPLPSNGQTQKTFEEEELSKHDISWSTFSNTDYYKDNIDKFKAMLANTEVSKEKEVSMPKDEEKKEMKAAQSDFPMVEKTVEDVEIKVVESSHTLRVDGPDVLGPRMHLELTAPPKPIIKSSFPSRVKMESSVRKMFHRQTAEGLEFVPPLDITELPLARLEWHRKQIDFYGGFYVGIENKWNPTDRTTKTVDSQAGYNMRSYYEQMLHADDQGKLLSKWMRFEAPHNEKKLRAYDRRVNYYGLQQEAEFIRALNEIESRNFYDVRDWYNFHRLWDSSVLKLQAIDNTIIFQKSRVWFDINYENYDKLMDGDPAFRQKIAQIIKGEVESSLQITMTSDRTAISELLRKIRMRPNQIDAANTIPTQINKADAAGNMRMISVILQLSRWVEGDVNLSLTTPSVAIITGLLLIRTITPRRLWSDRAVLRQNNYLAVWLLSIMPFIKKSVDPHDADKDVDLLDMILDEGDYWVSGEDQEIFRNFFYGWSDRGHAAEFPLMSVNGEEVPTILTNDHGSINLWHRSQVGYSGMDSAPLIRNKEYEFQQVKAFSRMIGVITEKGKNIRAWGTKFAEELRTPLLRILSDMSIKRGRIDNLCFGLYRAHRYSSLHLLTGDHQWNGGWVQVPDRTSIHIFDPAAFTKMFFFVDADKLGNLVFDNQFYYKSVGVHHVTSDFGDGLYIAESFMHDRRWTKTEIITEAAKFVKPHSLKDFLLTEIKERRKVLPFENLVPRAFFSHKLDAAERFFRSLTPAELKYSDSFIYTNGYRQDMVSLEPTDEFRVLLKAKRKNLPVLSVYELEDLIIKGELSEYMKRHKAIRFEIPIPIGVGKVSDMVKEPLKFSSGKVDVTKIIVARHDRDDDVRDMTDEFAMLNLGEYFIDIQPWNDVSADFPMENLIHEMTIMSELDIGVDIQYTPVRADPDILN